jgi:hypothetical protein
MSLHTPNGAEGFCNFFKTGVAITEKVPPIQHASVQHEANSSTK